MKGFKELWVSDETFQKEFLENPSSYYQQAPISWIVSIFGENPSRSPVVHKRTAKFGSMSGPGLSHILAAPQKKQAVMLLDI